jgi:hypothetical protein
VPRPSTLEAFRSSCCPCRQGRPHLALELAGASPPSRWPLPCGILGPAILSRPPLPPILTALLRLPPSRGLDPTLLLLLLRATTAIATSTKALPVEALRRTATSALGVVTRAIRPGQTRAAATAFMAERATAAPTGALLTVLPTAPLLAEGTTTSTSSLLSEDAATAAVASLLAKGAAAVATLLAEGAAAAFLPPTSIGPAKALALPASSAPATSALLPIVAPSPAATAAATTTLLPVAAAATKSSASHILTPPLTTLAVEPALVAAVPAHRRHLRKGTEKRRWFWWPDDEFGQARETPPHLVSSG